MCRNIKTLFNFEPPVTEDEVRAASLQFVRKICGFTKPSKANEAAFEGAIEEVAMASSRLLRALDNHGCPEEPRRRSGQGKGPRRATVRHVGTSKEKPCAECRLGAVVRLLAG